MRKTIKHLTIALLAITFIVGGSYNVKADEGMWLPFLVKRLNYADMQKKGLKLTAEEIYSINNSSLKDAIIQFGNGCTGEIISDQGLILTNHHCGYGKIQEHSTVDHDYLTDGFWAMKQSEELANPGFFVKFLDRIEDVTEQVLAEVNDDMTESERQAAVRKVYKELIEANSEEGKHDVVVKPFFNGNEYYMFVMTKYTDIRLVGAPPSSIGKFGGDTDNWMWPRHTGDFSMFRVYTAPDGSPAEYAEENVPMKPKHHLPVSVTGVKEGDYAMIMGYPGGTDRYMTSFGIQEKLDQEFPTRIAIRRAKLDIYSEGMKADPKVRIQYSTKYAHVANYWKNFIGMSKALKALKVVNEKKATEAKLTEWINADQARIDKYGTCIADIEAAYKIKSNYTVVSNYFFEGVYSGPEILKSAISYIRFLDLLKSENPDQEKVEKYATAMKASAVHFFKDYNKAIDMKVWAKMMEMYNLNVPAAQQSEYLTAAVKKYKGNYAKFADKVYSKTMFADQEKLNNFLDNPSAKTLEKDPAFIAIIAFYDDYKKYNAEGSEANDKLAKGDRLFVEALQLMEADKSFYPDANFTMRLTYGTVRSYEPKDAVTFNYFTTIEGIMQKEDNDNPEFTVPSKLKDLYKAKDYGQYGENGELKVCFLSDNDITGGNSGSPVINGNGELIGIAFDGNWEAMSGDIKFEPNMQRTINVDIRYVLFIIDKYAGATNLIEEMDLVTAKAELKPAEPIEEPAAVEKTKTN